jgi:prevent-host-death family protein
MKSETVSVSEFKARCLSLLEEVDVHGKRLVITKRGRPIASVSPVLRDRPALRGTWRGKVRISGDFVHFNETDQWENP